MVVVREGVGGGVVVVVPLGIEDKTQEAQMEVRVHPLSLQVNICDSYTYFHVCVSVV